MSTEATRGRPREFDREELLEKAMGAFWEHGYDGTTFARLEKLTGVHRQSFCYAFGDKRGLFNAVLEHYERTRVDGAIALLSGSGNPEERIRRVFDAWLQTARRRTRAGCFFINSGGLGSRDREVATVLTRAAGRIVAALEKVIAEGQASGHITAAGSAEDLAHQAVATADGGLLRATVARDPAFAEKSYAAFLRQLLEK